MLESVERAPPAGIPVVGTGARIGQQVDLRARRPERDRLLLEVDLRALVMGVGEGADEQQSPGPPGAQRFPPARPRSSPWSSP